MLKIFALTTSGLLAMALAAFYPPPPPDEPGAPPPPKAKEKEKHKAKDKEKKKKDEPTGPEGDLRRAYNLLRRLRQDDRSSGRAEGRLRDWTERAVTLYRDGVKAFRDDNARLAHEYSTAAHDLARTVEHARNASLFDNPDDDLPPPPEGPGPAGEAERVRRDLRRVYDRLRDLQEQRGGEDSRFYLDAARDLYNAARRDAEAHRDARAAELARAAEAMTHVPEHLAHAAERGPRPPRGDFEARKKEEPRKDFEPKKQPGPRDDGELAPPL